MTLPEAEFARMGDASDETLSAWIDQRFPRGVTAQWWRGVFEGLEINLSPVKPVPDSGRLGTLSLAARLPVLAARREEITETYAAYWLLRFAVSASHLGTVGVRVPVPPELGPDDAVSWALDHLPLSVPEARSLYPLPLAEDAPLSQVRAVQEIDRVVAALKWVIDRVADEDLRARARTWIALADG